MIQNWDYVGMVKALHNGSVSGRLLQQTLILLCSLNAPSLLLKCSFRAVQSQDGYTVLLCSSLFCHVLTICSAGVAHTIQDGDWTHM
jgi:hypothetical protein